MVKISDTIIKQIKLAIIMIACFIQSDVYACVQQKPVGDLNMLCYNNRKGKEDCKMTRQAHSEIEKELFASVEKILPIMLKIQHYRIFTTKTHLH